MKYQKIEFNDNDTVVKLMDSQQRPEGLFSQLEALASRSTGASAAQEAAFLTKLETIQLQRNVVEVHKAEKDVKPSFDVLYNNGSVCCCCCCCCCYLRVGFHVAYTPPQTGSSGLGVVLAL